MNNIAEEINFRSYAAAKEFAVGKESVGLADMNEPRAYGGKILGVTERHVVQNLGMAAVIHHVDDLDRIPAQGELVNISYVNGCGIVVPRVKGVERGLG